MKIIKMSQASRPLSEYAANLGGEIVVLTRRNKPVAAIVPLKGTDRESLALSGHPEFLDIIERSRADFRAGRTLSLEAMTQVFLAQPSPDRRMQPTKARRKPAAKRGARRRREKPLV